MRVLYLGASDLSSTSRHRAEALRRLGHEVDLLDPYQAVKRHTQGLLGALHYRTGYVMTRRVIQRWLADELASASAYDVCWVDNGELLSRSALLQLQIRARQLVLFNHDDPSGTRDRARFMTLRGAIPTYDLCVVVRPMNVREFRQLGARDVLRVWMRYDEVAHQPLDATRPVDAQYDNDIVFIGRRMNGEDRDLFMLALIQRGLKPAIWGDNWQSSKVWPALRPHWRGSSLSGQAYVDAIRGAKVCIGMLSKGNRDQHTTRTMEIPAARGLLCAERTDEHLELYRDGEEAVFWSSPEECAAQCQSLLADPVRREGIRQAGHRRLLINQVGNEDLCRTVLQRLDQLKAG
ncbi:MAG: glycosyltransferase family 1 protein [Rubrivivax sp.]|nr:MAG: glycosyltransferase family 1 protein [Rubrivivax sp.]